MRMVAKRKNVLRKFFNDSQVNAALELAPVTSQPDLRAQSTIILKRVSQTCIYIDQVGYLSIAVH